MTSFAKAEKKNKRQINSSFWRCKRCTHTLNQLMKIFGCGFFLSLSSFSFKKKTRNQKCRCMWQTTFSHVTLAKEEHCFNRVECVHLVRRPIRCGIFSFLFPVCMFDAASTNSTSFFSIHIIFVLYGCHSFEIIYELIKWNDLHRRQQHRYIIPNCN